MRRFLLLLLISALSLPALAQGRLVGSSADKRPAWVKRDVDRYDVIKVSYESTLSLRDAEDKAFESLRNHVVNTVTTYLMKYNVEGRSLEDIRSDVENSGYVRDISGLTSIDTYWEHRTVKKQDVYIYYILYDFNDFEKKKIAMEIDFDYLSPEGSITNFQQP
ncbi:MAG TPA: hypothetical protein IAC03_02490 [Candidatus Coprenecus pullistercoris]|nr:hypothetical protein [Candidatus Coprenecus pullistercoris]